MNGALEADESAQQEARKQYDIESTSPAAARPGRGGCYLEAARLSQPTPDIPPTPDHGKIAALKSRIRPGGEARAHGRSKGAWFAAAAAGILSHGRQARKSKSRGNLAGPSSNLETDDRAEKNSLSLLGHGSRASFIDASAASLPDGPTPSIQQTPEFAYSRPERPPSRLADSREISDNDSSTSLFLSHTEPPQPRPQSRLDYHIDEPVADGPSRSWVKGTSRRAMKALKRQASLVSTATADTFAYKREKNKEKMSDQVGSPDSTALGYTGQSKSHVARPAPAKLRTSGIKLEAADGRTVSEATSGRERASVRIVTPTIPWEHVPRDSLGISYGELVRSAPFRPSDSTSVDQLAPSGSCPRRQGARRTLVHLNRTAPVPVLRRQANWAILHESPAAKDTDVRGSAIRESAVRESGVTELMSLSRWPLAGKAAMPEKASRSPSPVGARANWGGTAGSGTSRLGPAASERGQGREDQHPNSDNNSTKATRRSGSNATSNGSSKEDFVVYI